MPRETANVVDEKGNHVAYQGVPIIEILRRAGATELAKTCCRKQVALYVLVVGLRWLPCGFCARQTRSSIRDRRILLVDRRDGKPLSSARRSLSDCRAGEKRHARWVHNVTSLAVKSAE